jgi:hypothetical protein
MGNLLTKVNEIKYISGPVSLSYYEIPETRQKIYLFGDLHFSKEKNCLGKNQDEYMEIDDFFDALSVLTNKTVDIILEQRDYFNLKNEMNLEIDYFKKLNVNNLNIGYFEKIFKKYNDCLLDKTNCSEKYNNIRLHLVDNRIGSHTYNGVLFFHLNYIISLLYETYQLNLKELKDKNFKYILKILEYYNNFIINYSHRNNINNERLKITKQINSIPNSFIREKLLQYKDECIEKNERTLNEINKRINKLINKINNYIKTKDFSDLDYILQTIPKIYNKFVKFSVLYMDLYTLGRLFRDFKLKREEDLERKTMKNVILYVGQAHKANFDLFIQNYLGIQPVFKTEVNNSQDYYHSLRCINIEKLKKRSFNEYSNK